MQIPTLGRTVLYTFTSADAEAINRRREIRALPVAPAPGKADSVASTINRRIQDGSWPEGAQAHVGNKVEEGQQAPAVVVRVFGTSPEAAVNLKVLLDGNDDYWVTSSTAAEEPTPGHFNWPTIERAEPKPAKAKAEAKTEGKAE